ncbi:MAG TPA: hypothetical protein DF712_18310 [Balneola sp.]|nr:hypothetical protein [Bacteroidota bacterium]HCI69164.1 hypothetical protein [Balneola sp.]HCT54405.1 hypothetical protein [Balneola sp.]|tara:strand:- start:740 stop:1033 length:294 start_codon:yes stop_codon:yes gene_type:complete
MNIRILDEAKQDLLKGYRFYESLESGIGSYFLDSLFSDIDSLVIYAGIHPKNQRNYHYMLAKKFPYAIYYKIQSSTILIYAVLDCRSNPSEKTKKLK